MLNHHTIPNHGPKGGGTWDDVGPEILKFTYASSPLPLPQIL